MSMRHGGFVVVRTSGVGLLRYDLVQYGRWRGSDSLWGSGGLWQHPSRLLLRPLVQDGLRIWRGLTTAAAISKIGWYSASANDVGCQRQLFCGGHPSRFRLHPADRVGLHGRGQRRGEWPEGGGPAPYRPRRRGGVHRRRCGRHRLPFVVRPVQFRNRW